MFMQKIMNSLKFFFNVLTKSLTKFSYYKEIAKANFKFSLKYLFFLFYILSLIGSIVFSVSVGVLVLPRVPQIVSYLSSKAIDLYPSGLTITIKNGLVSTNEKEPFYVDSLNQFGITKDFDHVLTIDTSASPSDIKNYKTLILITKDSFVTIKNNNSYEVRPIDKSTNFTIDQKSYSNLLNQITPYLKYLQPALIGLLIMSLLIWPFISAAFSLLGQLVYLLIFSLIFFVLVKLLKKDLKFKKLYQLAMHASTLPVLLGTVISILGIHMPFLLGSAILFVFMILIINEF